MVGALALAMLMVQESDSDFVRACQYPSGAIGMTGQGTGDRIVPYFANLACHALLAEFENSKEISNLDAVSRWLDWYGAHINGAGKIYDQAVKDAGGRLENAGTIDAVDSYASTYLVLVERWSRSAHSEGIRMRWPTVEKALNALQSLREENGLTIARADYPVVFLMDNTETYSGLLAASIMALKIGRKDQSDQLGAQAAETLNAIETELWDDREKKYVWAAQDGVQMEPLEKFYPDTMAQLMAIVRLPESERRNDLYKEIKRIAFPAAESDDQDELVWWTAACKSMGDTVSLRELQSRLKPVYAYQFGVLSLEPVVEKFRMQDIETQPSKSTA